MEYLKLLSRSQIAPIAIPPKRVLTTRAMSLAPAAEAGRAALLGKNHSLEGTKYPLAMSKNKERDPYPDTSGWETIRKTKMIRTLRITSFVAVILAVVFFVFPVIFGVRSDEQVEQFLSSSGVIEKFSKTKGDKDRRSESQISPLIKEAQAFALYLNPPPPKKKPPQPVRKKPTTPRPPARVSPKFKLIGVSYYASHPDLSLALIDEPGKGTRWVRQSSRVSHLVIEQVKDGLVVVRDGERTFELVPERREERSLVIKGKDSLFGQIGSKSTPMPLIGAGAAVKSDKAPQQPSAEEEIASLKTSGVKSDKAPQQLSAEEEIASLKKAIDELKAMGVDVESEKSDPIIEEFVTDLEAEIMRISAEEAKRLNDLGKELKDIQQDPNRADDNITESDANLSEPNLSDANLGDANLSEANSPEEE